MTQEITTIEQLNQANDGPLRECLTTFCAAQNWVKHIVEYRPYDNLHHLLETAARTWASMQEDDYMEAFDAHPMIGNIDTLKEKYANTSAMASGEQQEVQHADDSVLQRLANANTQYHEHFGFIFIVCATGKSASEMLTLLQARLSNDEQTELRIAAAEQYKITELRILKRFKGSE